MRIPLPVRITTAAFAPVFLFLWIVAEAGRDLAASTILAGVLAVAIGLCGWFPRVAAGVALAVPMLQLPGLLPSFSSTDWPIWFGVLIPVGALGFALRGARARLVAASAIAVASVAWGLGLVLDAGPAVLIDTALRGRPVGSMISWLGRADPGVLGRLGIALGFAVVAAALTLGTALAGAGFASGIRGSSERAARERAEADLAGARLEQAVAGERSRIAREVHDATAHSLAIVVAQADGALAEGTPGAADAALATIAETGRRALAEMRGLLERIDGEGPALGAEDIPALIEDVRAAGLSVRASIMGDADAVPTAVSLAVYRIVQESLTNALRHAAADATVDLTIDWRGAGAVVVVASSGAGDEDPVPGRGIAGMAERARMLGGWLSAGRSPNDSGGAEFVVTATLPYPAPAPIEVDVTVGTGA